MKIKQFYNDMKPILKVSIIIVKDTKVIWEGYIDEKRIYEHLMDYEIESIYLTDNGLGIVI